MATYPEYVTAAMRRAQYEQMEDGAWYASIPGLDGLWATGASVEEARADLAEALHGWIDVSLKVSGHRLPDLDSVSLYAIPQKVPD